MLVESVIYCHAKVIAIMSFQKNENYSPKNKWLLLIKFEFNFILYSSDKFLQIIIDCSKTNLKKIATCYT